MLSERRSPVSCPDFRNLLQLLLTKIIGIDRKLTRVVPINQCEKSPWKEKAAYAS